MSANYEWIRFYSAFADKLAVFENDRESLLKKLIKIHNDLGIKFQKLEEDDSVKDIDPFTVFGLFNKGQTDSSRVSIIRALAKEFEMDSSIKIPTSFEGVPTLNNLKAVFFGWNRADTDIDNLWSLFKVALQYADATDKANAEQQFIDIYDKIILQKCIRWNITMGLFWIRPNTFVNLDSRTRWFITEFCPELINGNFNMIKNVPNGETYIALSKNIAIKLAETGKEYKNFAELSYAAFVVSERHNEMKRGQRDDDTDMLEEDANAVHYWLYSPGHGGEKWDEFYKEGIMAIGWELGDLSKFENKAQIKAKMRAEYNSELSYRNDVHAVWQFAHEIKKGDIIFVKRGIYQIIGRGEVESDYIYDNSRTDGYKNIIKVKWTHKGVWQHPGKAAQKTLTDITPYTEYVKKLNAMFENSQEEALEEKEIIYPPYSAENFLNDVYMSEEDYNTLTDLLSVKKNVVLQGAPGVGKTYAARRLAYSIMGVQDPERVMTVQFHQSYSYEDFIMGYRPTENGTFQINHGSFYNFCKKAEEDGDNAYFFIIDEINRGNLSKIFGELFVLLEADKRSKVKMQLLYADEKFTVPENLYIIGTMNTADRSLAMLDYALRRRFAFFELKPAFSYEKFVEYRTQVNNPKFDRLIKAVVSLNNAISDDEALGEGFQIGHSYFCNFKEVSEKRLSNIVEYEIIPMLKEYWFDEPSKVREWSDILRSALK